jgi:hypothetical protein
MLERLILIRGWRRVVCGILLLSTGVAAAVQTPAPLPLPADRQIDFARDVEPILRASCARCHARGQNKGGFSIESRDSVLAGSDDGPAVVPGKSGESLLISLVAGVDPDAVMPKKGSRLTAAQVGILRAWIDQGLAWDPSVSFAKAPPRNLTRRGPALPPEQPELRNPVDRLLTAYYASHHRPAPTRADDRTFARRLYFDLIGVPPTPAELRAFLADHAPDRRARLAERLLADRVRYAEHWLTFWNDALRNDYRGTGYIDGGRKQITAWLFAALVNNLPYDRFVAQLVDPVPGADGFTNGIVWRGVVNASQTPQLQAAQSISQVFMGVNLKCASCHDSFINDWQLADAYGLASVYSDAPLEMVECDKPTGRTATARFIYPELGSIDAQLSKPDRLRQLATIMTSPANGRLSRTIVNRLWARLMGRGLVEPVDDMEQPAWNADLLDWLAEDLVANRYDLKKTIRRIVTSQAYQAVAVDAPERVESYEFTGPLIKRLTAEQFEDAVSAIAGDWHQKADGQFDFWSAGVPDPASLRRVRAALVAADPLMTALGRPNREQVMTVRSSAATTLQALELTSGATLNDRLRRAADRLLADRPGTAQLVSRVYLRALGRSPTTTEASLCRRLLGAQPRATDVQDLLWAVVMLPEFQLVH